MQDQINDTVGLETLGAMLPPGWQAAAVGEYEQTLSLRRADLRAHLAARIVALTGRKIPLEDIYTDGRLAVAGVDSATFRLHRSLHLIRTCTYCGTGSFEGPEISSRSDLGYALSAWRPLHEDCEDCSSEDSPDF